jgi:hypothetical protein
MLRANIRTSDIKSPILRENNPTVILRLHERNGRIGFTSGNMIFAIRLLDKVLIFVRRSNPINILNISCSVAKTISFDRLSSPGLFIKRYITKLTTIIIVMNPIRLDSNVPPRGRPQEYISLIHASWLLPPRVGSLLCKPLRYSIYYMEL